MIRKPAGIMKSCFILVSLIVATAVQAQEQPKSIDLEEVEVTASRNRAKKIELATSITVVDSTFIDMFPMSNIDNLLLSVAGVYVNRSSGIYSKNATLTMRGFDGSNRVLVLYDGLPLNQLAGGGINWHLFNVNTADKIEVLRGANSSQFGNNAISGIINIETKKPAPGFGFTTALSYASYNTMATRNSISYNNIKGDRGYFLTTTLFYRKGDGYFNQPPTDTTRAKLFLDEKSAEVKYHYQLNAKNSLVFNYNVYSDTRGEGVKVYEPKGGFLNDLSNMLTATYSSNVKGFDISVKSMFHLDLYEQQSERLNRTGDKYKLYDVNETTRDYMFLTNAIKQVNSKMKVNFGSDFKNGMLDGIDKYYTSTDYIERGGNLSNIGVFGQMEYKILPSLNSVVAIRFDHTKFYNGYLHARGTTTETNIPDNTRDEYKSSGWSGLSPKVGFKYMGESFFQAYATVSTGFTPPKLDDMVSSRKINKGFKIANPNLKPENVINYEVGSSQTLFGALKLEQAISYSLGTDFHYFLTLQPATASETAVYQRQNIGKVEIYGGEFSAKYVIHKGLFLSMNYSFYNSEILKIHSNSETDQTIVGKKLSEVPFHQAFAGAGYKHKRFSTFVSANFIGKQWADEQNTLELERYATVDIDIQARLYKGLYVNALVQNIFDHIYIDKKGGLCPGRFIELELGYRF